MSTHDVILVRIPGDPAVATRKLMEVFGIDEERAVTLLESVPTPVKRATTLKGARTYYEAFRSMGAEAQIRETTPVDWETKRSQTPSRPVPKTLEPPVMEPLPRWLKGLWIIPLFVIAGLVYWQCRAETMGGLEIHHAGPTDGGRPVVILLHGFGAPGDDLVPLAEELSESVPNVHFIMPEGPIEIARGRAWWSRDPSEVGAARDAVSEIIDELIDDGTPASMIVVAGFSQGAILAMEVGLQHREMLGGVGFLSGREGPNFDWTELLTDRQRLPIFVSHGRRDNVLPYARSVRLKDKLEASNFEVDFVPFDGGHEIPLPVRTAFAGFLSARL